MALGLADSGVPQQPQSRKQLKVLGTGAGSRMRAESAGCMLNLLGCVGSAWQGSMGAAAWYSSSWTCLMVGFEELCSW